MKQRIPLRALDIHLENEPFAHVAVLGELILQGVEHASFLGLGAVVHALRVKDRIAVGTRRLRGVEAIVLMHLHPKRGRHVATPLVISGNAVGVAGLDATEQIRANQIAAIVRFAKPRKIVLTHLYPEWDGQSSPAEIGGIETVLAFDGLRLDVSGETED